ncbi:hypothetical protein Tco_1114688 [Tanacetum coccineum]|uniref:Uncharacterized protein n=1 Tax=Tanacetum coccineum TaxID=301880 RepID=A0ABQ5IVU9_9ASTR
MNSCRMRLYDILKLRDKWEQDIKIQRGIAGENIQMVVDEGDDLFIDELKTLNKRSKTICSICEIINIKDLTDKSIIEASL